VDGGSTVVGGEPAGKVSMMEFLNFIGGMALAVGGVYGPTTYLCYLAEASFRTRIAHFTGITALGVLGLVGVEVWKAMPGEPQQTRPDCPKIYYANERYTIYQCE
jgi:hypothetical protein